VKALERRDPNTHAYLFHGPSGTGKTTLGRIVARGEIIEVDAATFTGIDAMRGLVETARAPSIMDSEGERTIIVDECHRLSGQAWDSLLKVVEEPPAHLYWVFCTTNLGKVPKTIQTRCETYGLKPVDSEDIADLLERVADREGIKTTKEILSLAAKTAEGSPRQALAYLAVLNGVKDKEEALALMQTATERDEVIDFIKYLVFDRNASWEGAQKHLKGLKEAEVDAESIRIVCVNFVSACALNAKPGNTGYVKRLMAILDAFGQPYPQTDKYGPLLLSVANCVLS
jgi:DNA polymerase III gamma/tau subunit